jgi:hypothetical protein
MYKNLGNAFLNAQQMFDQQANHKALSIPLYHVTRLFQFISTCEDENKAFVATKKLEHLPSNST